MNRPENTGIGAKTPAAQQMGDQTAFPSKAIPVPLQRADGTEAAQVEETLPPGYDKYFLSKEDYEYYGMDYATEEHAWIRNPKIWMQHEGGDRALQFRRENPGGRIIEKDGERVQMEDLILVARPRRLREIIDARSKQEMSDYEERLRERETPFDKRERDALEHQMIETRQFAQDMGFVGAGSPTHRMSLEDAYSRYTKAEIMAEEDRARRQGRTAPTATEEQQMAAEARVAEARETGSRKSFGGYQKAAFLKGPGKSKREG